MFADHVGLLPDHMFTRMQGQARRAPDCSTDLAASLFRGMAKGGLVGIEPVDWVNSGLLDDDATLTLERADVGAVLAASKLDWSEIDQSIFGTPFRAWPRPWQPGTARRALHRPRQDHAVRRAGDGPPVARRVGDREGGDRGRAGAGGAAKSLAARTKCRNEADPRPTPGPRRSPTRPGGWSSCATAGSTRPNGWTSWFLPGYAKRPAPRDEDAAKPLEEAHPDQPLRRSPAVARRRP